MNLLFTREVNDAVAKDRQMALDTYEAIKQFEKGDWGETSKEDHILNDQARETGEDRVVAMYKTCTGDIFIITEADQSATTVMYCNQY